jgi:glutamate dehydrogenase/leucine dehydrogenase
VFDYWQGCVVGDNPVAQVNSANRVNAVPDFRTVALIIAIKRVADATLMRGIWP